MTRYSACFLVSSMLTLCACDNDPVKDAPRAEAAAPVESKNQAQAKAEETSVLALTPENSQLNFVGAKVTDTHEGSFEKLSGELRLVAGDPTKSSVTVTIDVASLTIEPEKLESHLRSPDFFDVEKFPEAKFASTSIAKEADGSYKITGNLNLHGVTKSISFPGKIEVQEDTVVVKAKFGINRKDFGIVYPGMPDDLIKDEVLIDLNLNPKKS